MRDAARRSLQPESRATAESLSFLISPKGNYLAGLGPGQGRCGGPLRGRTIEEVLGAYPELLEKWRVALRDGVPFAGGVDAFGVAWVVEADPVHDDDGKYAGLAAHAIMMEPIGDEEEDPEDVEEWVCLSPVRAGGVSLRPEDVMIRRGPYWSITRRAAPADCKEIIRRKGAHLQQASASVPQSSRLPGVRTVSRRRARHLWAVD